MGEPDAALFRAPMGYPVIDPDAAATPYSEPSRFWRSLRQVARGALYTRVIHTIKDVIVCALEKP